MVVAASFACNLRAAVGIESEVLWFQQGGYQREGLGTSPNDHQIVVVVVLDDVVVGGGHDGGLLSYRTATTTTLVLGLYD